MLRYHKNFMIHCDNTVLTCYKALIIWFSLTGPDCLLSFLSASTNKECIHTGWLDPVYRMIYTEYWVNFDYIAELSTGGLDS